MKNEQLINLCSRTWSLTALGLLASGVPGRVSPLAAAAECGRISMSASVEHLQVLGLIERNPGHGHPLRPEFRLLPHGQEVADWALELFRFIPGSEERSLVRSKWSLPLLACLPDEQRYSDLRRQLNPVTDRALSKCLSKLTEGQWLKRRVQTDLAPPLVTYRTVNVGKRLHEHLQSFPVAA